MSSPSVSIVFPILNEVESLSSALNTLIFESDYPQDSIEVLLIDGGSSDGTVELIESLCEEYENFRYLRNTSETTPHAMNLGIRESRYEIILRADAHALYHQGYVRKSVDLLTSHAGDNIGGHLKAIQNSSTFSEVLSLILNTSFGNGGAGYKGSAKECLVDTVWCGCWFKSTLEDIGGFDTLWITNQDAELNARLRNKGYSVYCTPEINASLVVRNSYRAFLKQYFRYGKGRAMTLLRYPDSIKLRQAAPLLAVFGLISLIIVKPILPITVLFLLAIFSTIMIGNELNSKGKVIAFLWVVPILVGMNVLWVLGFFTKALEIGFSKDLRRRILNK